jgi:hypothetical protein
MFGEVLWGEQLGHSNSKSRMYEGGKGLKSI